MSTYLNQLNTPYIESLLAQYESDPQGVEPTWRAFFDGVTCANGHAKFAVSPEDVRFEFNVLNLVQAYRNLGYVIADVNPLDRTPKSHPLLELAHFGLEESDLSRTTHVGQFVNLPAETLNETLEKLRRIYASPVAVEFGHIADPASRQWIQERVEAGTLLQPLDIETKKRTLQLLLKTEGFETFIHQRFVAQKRFSIEGNDVMVPMIEALIYQAAQAGEKEIIFGMAHRGRLSLLANVFHKDITSIFAEFLGTLQTNGAPGDGDVKYHLGFSGKVTPRSGKPLQISLISNPSHLEAINPVVMGIARKKQTLAVLLHGDASFAGQGSIYELLNMSELRGYKVDGIIHIIINNQIGFTTNSSEGRSTPHATDVAKMLEVPIFRVNADEPEAALRCMQLAFEYRSAFKRDVFIDLIGYRRYGHNEGDEPSFTQPLLYQKIHQHPRVAQQYAQRLISEGVVSEEDVRQLTTETLERHDALLTESKKAKIQRASTSFEETWKAFQAVPEGEKIFERIKTSVSKTTLLDIGKKLIALPSGFQLHPKLQRLLQDRNDMLMEKRGLDWGFAEALTFGSLLMDGFPIRLAGQDSERGTFSHRHAALYDIATGEKYIPLAHLTSPTRFEVVNSLLSECAALGFEFGQSLASPHQLTMWEAQFGDFANGGQMIIDQFIMNSAFKWQYANGLVLLLPHGYEGQGPEHSSARIERFLQACAQHNVQVCNPTLPAQLFHLLRRHMLRNFRLPLIMMTPKSGLRHPRATSKFDDFEHGTFEEVLDDENASTLKHARRLLLCSGKIFYELVQERDAKKLPIPILRLEQIYPFPEKNLEMVLKNYKKAKTITWCQEEPQNMGGWNFVRERLRPLLDQNTSLEYVGRPPQANVSGGYFHVHEAEQRAIVAQALGE